MPFMGLFALPAERGPMSDTRPCKNFQEGDYSGSCKRWIEDDRPKSARYCKACGASRSRVWKHEHPERAKLYANEEAVKNWRERNNWNQYVQDWRELHRERSREQTRRAVRAYRERKRRREEGAFANASFDSGDETSPRQPSENASNVELSQVNEANRGDASSPPTEFAYDEKPIASFITKITRSGYLRRPNGSCLNMFGPGILRSVIFLLWLFASATVIQAQNSRASSATSYLERGNQWLEKGDWDRAIADYDLAVVFDPSSYRAFYNRGLARDRKGDLVGAISDYSKTIDLNPRFVAAYLNRGAALYEMGEIRSALRDFDRAIELNPREVKAYVSRGTARQKVGDTDGALADSTEAIRLDHRDDVAWGNRCGLRYVKQEYAAALSDCNQALQLNPHNDAAWGNRGLFRTAKGDAAGAVTDFDQALKLNPHETRVYWYRGAAYLLLGKLEEAGHDFNKYRESGEKLTHAMEQVLRETYQRLNKRPPQ
jgi:tetratricopeptide (TPR) repeat protein